MTTWQIGESGTAIALDGTGKGEVTFRVTNAGTAPDRAVLTINALDGAADSWFTVPEPQRAVAPGASVLYPVGVTNAGLQPVVQRVPSNTCDNLVESQDPAADTVVPAGSAVTIEVTFFDPPTEDAECP